MSGNDFNRSRNRAHETRDPAHYTFHSSREERLGERDEQENQQTGIFRGNRSLLIILLDVLLVLLMFLLYIFFLRSEPGVTEVGQYRVEGSAFTFSDELYVTVTVHLAEDEAPAAGDETILTVRFPDGQTITDVLPSDTDYPTVVRHVFPADAVSAQATEDGVEVGLTLLGDREDLTIPLEE